MAYQLNIREAAKQRKHADSSYGYIRKLAEMKKQKA